MFKHVFAALIALSPLPAMAETAAPPDTASTCTLPQIADTAQLAPLSGTDLMTVPVQINAKNRQFLLDLALGRPTEVSPQLVAELGLPEDTPLTRNGSPYGVYDVISGMGGWTLDTHVKVGAFGVGNATGRHLVFTMTKKGEIAGTAPYDGFLTGDFFRQYDTELDFAGKTVRWLTPTKCTDPNQVVFWPHREVAVIPVTLAGDGRLAMQAMVQGHLINAEFDTTSPHTVMRRDIAELFVGLKPEAMEPLDDLKDGRGMQIYVHNFAQLIFAGGGITAENVPVLIQDFSLIPAIYRPSMTGHREDTERIPDITIGMDVLRHLHMYVVPGQSRIYVTSAQSGAE